MAIDNKKGLTPLEDFRDLRSKSSLRGAHTAVKKRGLLESLLKPITRNALTGLTLVEILISIMVLGVAIAPLLGVFTSGTKQSGVSQKITTAYNLGQDLMEEIIAKQFDEDPLNPIRPRDLGPDSREHRYSISNPYDDVDDYDGYSESPPQEEDGTDMTDYTGFTRSVIVEYVTPTNFDVVSTNTSTQFKRIKITVSWDSGNQSVTLTAIKGNY
jgi:MSHA pilin protein MshD